jgi:hypothetical protein
MCSVSLLSQSVKEIVTVVNMAAGDRRADRVEGPRCLELIRWCGGSLQEAKDPEHSSEVATCD